MPDLFFRVNELLATQIESEQLDVVIRVGEDLKKLRILHLDISDPTKHVPIERLAALPQPDATASSDASLKAGEAPDAHTSVEELDGEAP